MEPLPKAQRDCPTCNEDGCTSHTPSYPNCSSWEESTESIEARADKIIEEKDRQIDETVAALISEEDAHKNTRAQVKMVREALEPVTCACPRPEAGWRCARCKALAATEEAHQNAKL